MRQLQIFTAAELSKMRDPTKRRSYFVGEEEFRREHERRRACWKAHLHALRLHRLREKAGGFLLSDSTPPRLYESAYDRRRAAGTPEAPIPDSQFQAPASLRRPTARPTKPSASRLTQPFASRSAAPSTSRSATPSASRSATPSASRSAGPSASRSADPSAAASPASPQQTVAGRPRER
jgi:hypothetical protein